MYTKKEKKLIGWIGFIVVLFLIFILFRVLKSILFPFILSMILAYIFNPLVNKLQNIIPKREIAIIIIILIFFCMIVIFLISIIPILVQQITSIYEILPHMLKLFNIHAIPWLNNTFHMSLNIINLDTITSFVSDHTNTIKLTLPKLLLIITKKGGGAINLLIDLILTPFLLYYFLLDWSLYIENAYKLVPRRFYDNANKIMHEINKVLGQFLKGQLTVMFLMSIIFGLALTATGLNNGFLIGIISGLLVFIPYLGAIIGLFLATLTAILQFNGLYHVLLVIVVFFVCHLLESLIITPKLVGNKIGISPVLVIFSLFAFGKLLGFTGLLLSLPLSAICSVLFREGLKHYLSSDFYLNR